MTIRAIRVDDAMDRASASEIHAPDAIDAVEMQEAAVALMNEVSRLRQRVAVMEAVSRKMVSPILPRFGEPLVEVDDEDSGPRHFLGGYQVRAGTHLYLLTNLGWLPGRYEWHFEPGTCASFYFSLAGVGQPVACRIPADAHLAWPNQAI